MSTITLPNIRVGSDLQVRVRLKDGGVAIDWSTLTGIKAYLYSDEQRSMASRCTISVDEEDSTLLVCQYAASKPQYLGENRIVVCATYMGETKNYDKPALNFVRWTADQEGEQITIDDPDVDVEIEVSDVSSSILDEAIRAAINAAEEAGDAADRAIEAAEAAEHMVDIHTGPEGKSAYEVAVEEGYTGTEEEWLASLKGDTGETPDITIGTVTTAEPGTPAAATMTGTPEDPVLNLTIPKGAVGATPNFTVGTVTTGAPGSQVVVTITGTPEAPVLNLTIPQGMQGNTGSSVAYPYELVNNRTTDDATKGLSAAEGKRIGDDITQLEAKVTNLKGKFYGFYPTAEDLPEGDEDGFAYVGDDSPYAVYNFRNEEWTDSGSVVTISGTSFTPDDEDLSLDNSVLKFADRPYNSQTPDGLGYKILRKDATFASQVTATNTIYEIRYDFTISANVSIPANCELRFNGGKIIGGGNTITLNKTLISGNGKFDGCEFAGTLINGEVLLSWFTDGMSNNTDYSVDHTTALISAMKLTACKYRGWLNLERIPIYIAQTVTITQAYGNIGMKGGNVFFRSSADAQALFDYNQTTAGTGVYSPIVDFKATYVGKITGTSKHTNVCFIKKTSWSEAVFTYWRDIKIYGFNGYFFVELGYLQEVTFQNIACEGCGFFTTNSDGLFGEGKGSANILHFLNCSVNNGPQVGTSIHYLFDLHNIIEARLVNTVLQGSVTGSNIYPIHISSNANSSIYNSNITLDCFWVEYPGGNVNGKILIEDSTCILTMRGHCPLLLDIESGYVTVKFENAAPSSLGNTLTNSVINDSANVDWQIDSCLFSPLDMRYFPRFRELADKGIIGELRNGISNYKAQSVPITLKSNNKIDILSYYASLINGGTISNTNLLKRYFKSENGVDVLCFEEDTGVKRDVYGAFVTLKDFLPYDSLTTFQGKSVFYECIYKVTILVDVTSENISSVICKASNFIDVSSKELITPAIGDLAGTTTGWIRGGYATQPASYTSGSTLNIQNCKLEIAYYVGYFRNGYLTNDVLLKENGAISNPNNIRKIYQMSSIPSAKDNVTDMSDIIRGATGIFVTPKNVYMYVNGAVRAIYDYNAKGGTTAQRPTLASGDVGFTYYDSTLGKTIVWNGTAWVNMDGTALS